jgi:hypothetical protein
VPRASPSGRLPCVQRAVKLAPAIDFTAVRLIAPQGVVQGMLRAQSLTAGRDFHEATNPRIMDITKPIIIVGTGRCGSTLFHRLLAKHPQMMWLSPLCYKYPHRPEWNRRAVAAMDNPLLRRLFGEKIRPGENYRFWDKYAYGFSEPCREEESPAHQDHRMAPDRLPERDLSRREVHPRPP